MDTADFVNALEDELEKRYDHCQDFAATPCSILLAVLDAVAAAKKIADCDHDYRAVDTMGKPVKRCALCGDVRR